MANFNQPKRQQIIDAYRNGTDEQKKVLVGLFGEIEPKNVMERVKTFEDACRELGKGHEYVKDYRALKEFGVYIPDDVLAYYKIRIICAALNEGWKPDYTDDNQYKYYTWVFYADKSYVNKHPEINWHKIYTAFDHSDNSQHCAFFRVDSFTSLSDYGMYCPSRSIYKSRELAIYALEQFFDIYADYMIR
jgi:hypothetical protein